MKKVLLFLAWSIAALPAMSQVQEYRRFMPGIKFGAVVTGAIGNDFESSATGFHNTHTASGALAFYGDYRLNDLWALGSELGFTVVREKGKARGSYNDGTRAKFYVTPVIAKLYLFKAKRFHLTLAPELGITARRLHYYASMWSGPYPEYKYNPVTFAINSGLGYRFNKGVVFHAEYSAGLTRVVHKNHTSAETSAKDGMFRFTIGVDLYRRRR